MWKLTFALTAVVLSFSCSSLLAQTESESAPIANTNNEVIAPVVAADASAQDYQRQHQNNHDNVNQLGDDEPIRYDGAQVWRLGFSDTRDKNAVSDLQHEYGKAPSGRDLISKCDVKVNLVTGPSDATNSVLL